MQSCSVLNCTHVNFQVTISPTRRDKLDSLPRLNYIILQAIPLLLRVLPPPPIHLLQL